MLAKLAETFGALPDGYEVSREEIAREKQQGRFASTEGLGYGEIDLAAFAALLQEVVAPSSSSKDDKRLEFVDFGSGTGKAVLVAACAAAESDSLMFGRCTGVELMKPLHAVAQRALAATSMASSSSPLLVCPVEFVCGDMFADEELWRRADVIFITCTLFTDEMMQRVNDYVQRLVRHGALVLCTTRKLETSKRGVGGLALLKERRIKYAKGSLLCHVYRRHRKDEAAAAAAPVEEKKKKRVKVEKE